MKKVHSDPQEEFHELTHNLSEAMLEVKDSIAIGTMLYTIAEEKKSSNLIIREINGKFDNLMEKIEKISTQLAELNQLLRKSKKVEKETFMLSERDKEILDFIEERKIVCADDIKKKFNYKGRNAASARLSKLFKDNLLEKEYVGRKVYYRLKS